jgi:hypothetical protein
MPLTNIERKERLAYGQQKEVADRLGEPESYISLAMAGEIRPKTKRAKLRLRRAQVALARAMGLRVSDAFDPIDARERDFARAS